MVAFSEVALRSLENNIETEGKRTQTQPCCCWSCPNELFGFCSGTVRMCVFISAVHNVSRIPEVYGLHVEDVAASSFNILVGPGKAP